VSADEFVDFWARDHGQNSVELRNRDRSRRLTRARCELVRAMREVDFSLPEIGFALRRHHTTILHLARRVWKAT